MKKKGFTLIELLAVIIILAVIALIAAPVVLNIIEQVKIKGAESSAKGYAKAVEYEILNDTMFKGKNLDGEYDVEENVLEVVYQGNGPSEGYFILTRNEITYGEFCINGYGIRYENSIGKYAPDEVKCNGGNEIVFVEPEGVACTDIENYDEETNFKIKTVEDLVCVSNLSKSGKTFSGKTIMLLSDIDINDGNSYNDINNTTYGDINGNGTVEGIQVELTTGSGFNPIGSSSAPFSGTFEGYGYTLSNLMINRNVDNVGLFGYVTNGTIRGITISNINVKGNSSVGGTVGYLNSGIVNEINLSGNVTGTANYIGGIVGYSNASGNKISSVIANVNVSGSKRIGGILGYTNSSSTPTVTGVIENGTISGSYAYKVGYVTSSNVYVSNNVTASSSHSSYSGTAYTLNDQMLNSYDAVIDTWIGGDNDSSGYYFDYDSNNKIVVKSVEREPITFTLKGEGTEEKPYIINNYQQWKEATTKVKQDVYFKLNNDIDFSGKNYYAIGTTSNYLVATIDGDNNTLSNINIKGANNTGLIGYNNGGTLKGLNIDTITVTSDNDNIGGVVGNNNKGSIIGLNINNATIKGNNYIGGIVGYLNSGIVNEINLSGNVTGTENYIGGIVGYNNASENRISNVLVNINATGSKWIGGILGYTNSASTPTVRGVVETGTISSGGYAYKVGYVTSSNVYVSNNVNATSSHSSYSGIAYTLELPTTVTYTENNNRIEVDSLSYYDSVGILDTRIGGDNDSSGYYFDYNSLGNKIIVVPVGTGTNPGGGNTGSTGSVEIDSNYTMTQINGTTDTTAPTCELYYVRAVSNGIQASFSCTDDSGVPTLRSLFDSTTSKSAATFDNIGTLKNGSVSGNTKTVVSTWNVNNTISQPTPGTCYYFRYGAKDAQNNFSTYVTNVCYTGFSE